MSETTRGIRAILGVPWCYTAFQNLVGGRLLRRRFTDEYIRPRPGDRILDIGCGPGNYLEVFPAVDYVGFDVNPRYIAAAQKRFAGRGQFRCEPVSEDVVSGVPPFDIVLAIALLHHIDDEEACRLFRAVRGALKPSGRLVTVDCCYTSGQSLLAKSIISMDRGRNIRTPAQYSELAGKIFSNISISLRNDMLRIPYTHVILEMTP